MKMILNLFLAAGLASCAAPETAESSENICVFSSAKDFLVDEGAMFPTHGMRMNFGDGAGFTPYRAFVIESCAPSAEFYCFSSEYLTFGIPKRPVFLGQSWVIGSDTYAYEQNVEIKLLGRTETFGVVSRVAGGKIRSKVYVSDARGLGAIVLFDDDGRANYQTILQGDACHPFPIRLGSAAVAPTGEKKT